jgi:hypothetical protein
MNRFEKHKLATILLVILILGVAFELILRFGNFSIVEFAYNYGKAYRYHDDWRRDFEPNTQSWVHLSTPSHMPVYNFIITTNKDAIRVPDRPLDNNFDHIGVGTKIVHCLGDSFVMGWGVSYAESYPANLDFILESGYRAVNMGLNAYGTIAETEKSIRLWNKYPANYSILFFYVNDYDDDVRAHRHQQKSFAYHKLCDCWNWMRHHTYTANVPYALHYLRYWSGLLASLPKDVVQTKLSLSDAPEIEIVDVKAEKSKENWGDLSKSAMLKYRDFLASKKVPFMVIALYDGEESKDMHLFCREHNIESYLIKIPEALRLKKEGHINQMGNYRLAQFIANWVKKQN